MKVGDYVRTKYGNVGKITNLNKQFSQVEYQDNQTRCDTKENNILKSSSNIIDILETGDYVNGYLVTMIDKDAYGEPIVFVGQRLIEESGYYRSYYSKNIKTIVTKEQFSQMEYKIGR